ncbi:hypothetical protein DL93DRAFT_2093344 [Clavulina sp. PMI_390]|nr:hypothetical protein DL93DRAFT_2093344 [Clavulina sp. PMI_390]
MSSLLSALSLFTLTLFIRPSTCASDSTVQVQLPSSVPSYNVIQDNFPGISLEFNVLDHLIGPSPSNVAVPMVNYLKNLRSRMSSDFRLRIGGNSLDGSFYDPTATQMINFNLNSTANGIKNIPVTYGPQVLTTLKQLGSDVGGIYHLLDLSLVYPYNDTDVVKFAQAAQQVLGSSLDSLLTGNEPDLYAEDFKRPANYSVFDYSAELNKVVGDLRQGSVSASIGAPSLCCSHPDWGLADVLGATLNTGAASNMKYASLQHYPQQACDSVGINRWNISYLTNHSAVQDLMNTFQADGVLMAKNAGKQVIMDEFNTASCGGQVGRSDTFAAAMWTVDYELGMAANNYSAGYLHTREPGVAYDIFTYPNTTSVANSGWQTGPQYYSLLLLTEALSTLDSSSTGSVVVDLDLPNPTVNWGYAIYDSSALNSAPRTLVLSNAGTSSMSFTIPSGLAPSSTLSTVVRTMTAPSLTDKSSVTYAGQLVDGTGTIQGTHSQTTVNCQNGCSVQVPGPGVVLVVLQTQSGTTAVVPEVNNQPSSARKGLVLLPELFVTFVLSSLGLVALSAI